MRPIPRKSKPRATILEQNRAIALLHKWAIDGVQLQIGQAQSEAERDYWQAELKRIKEAGRLLRRSVTL